MHKHCVLDVCSTFKDSCWCWFLIIIWAPMWENVPADVHPMKTWFSLRISAVWLESLLSVWRNIASFTIQYVLSEDSGQTARMHKLIWIFTGHVIRYIFWCCGSYYLLDRKVRIQLICIFGYEYWDNRLCDIRKNIFRLEMVWLCNFFKVEWIYILTATWYR